MSDPIVYHCLLNTKTCLKNKKKAVKIFVERVMDDEI